MNRADCEFHVCMGVLRLKLEPKSVGIHEIPIPQNQIHIISLAHVFTEQLHEIKYHEIYYPRNFKLSCSSDFYEILYTRIFLRIRYLIPITV